MDNFYINLKDINTLHNTKYIKTSFASLTFIYLNIAIEIHNILKVLYKLKFQ